MTSSAEYERRALRALQAAATDHDPQAAATATTRALVYAMLALAARRPVEWDDG